MFRNGMKLKIFVRETETNSDEKSADKKFFVAASLTGDKAKEFYEEVIGQPPSSPPDDGQKPRAENKPKRVRRTAHRNRDLLRLAQDNDLEGLERFFAAPPNDFDVNAADDFGWTPLMCASCSGAAEAAEVLLRMGADVHRRDRSGNTAAGLARQKNHKRIAEMLDGWKGTGGGGGGGGEMEEEALEDGSEPFVCETCKETFADRSGHDSSTVHLFHCKMKTCTFYGIPESNRGFQLLLREGWDRESGLGREGKGRKFPVKAMMKRDRRGIGAGAEPKTRPEGSERDGRHGAKHENKKRRAQVERRDKEFEKKFRLEFSR